MENAEEIYKERAKYISETWKKLEKIGTRNKQSFWNSKLQTVIDRRKKIFNQKSRMSGLSSRQKYYIYCHKYLSKGFRSTEARFKSDSIQKIQKHLESQNELSIPDRKT